MAFTEGRMQRQDAIREGRRRAAEERAARWSAVTTERIELEIHSRRPSVQRELEEAIAEAPFFWKRKVARWALKDFLQHINHGTGRDSKISIAEHWMHLSPDDLS